MGNHHFSIAEYDKALILYSAAVEKADELNDTEALILNLCNRSACYFQMEQYEQAQMDAHQAVETSEGRGMTLRVSDLF
jgi:tetratricopeptide (TPR) repeat protein